MSVSVNVYNLLYSKGHASPANPWFTEFRCMIDLSIRKKNVFFFVGHNKKYKVIFFRVKNASGRGDSGWKSKDGDVFDV